MNILLYRYVKCLRNSTVLIVEVGFAKKVSLLRFREMNRPLLFTKRNGIPPLLYFATEAEFRRNDIQFRLVSSSAE